MEDTAASPRPVPAAALHGAGLRAGHKTPLVSCPSCQNVGISESYWKFACRSDHPLLHHSVSKQGFFLFVCFSAWFIEHLAFCSSRSYCGKGLKGDVLESKGSTWWDQQLSHLHPSLEWMALRQAALTHLGKGKNWATVADWKPKSGLDDVPEPSILTPHLGSEICHSHASDTCVNYINYVNRNDMFLKC